MIPPIYVPDATLYLIKIACILHVSSRYHVTIIVFLTLLLYNPEIGLVGFAIKVLSMIIVHIPVLSVVIMLSIQDVLSGKMYGMEKNSKVYQNKMI
ncbi:hypothetical protein ISN45_Aa05g013880 [Arabidopsis thaliana x Arabidopsis arenosa]|uniref:Transmembrane protein n=1 Tax=Arabidopsis thaliana x Arabidopsis arenosa TaxID=1240361 RepID=A0A8T1ZNR2_9BRAS|nr:hypothetical protein ISN45_Aa05g013880 [Arabidopsis thaliana x Arabidopsis arenosa]